MREGNNTLALRDKVAAADPVIRTMRDDLRLVSSPNSPPLKTVTPPKAEPQRNPTVRAELQRNPAVRAEPQLSRSANPVSTGRNPTGRATPSPPRPPSLPPTTHQPPQPPPHRGRGRVNAHAYSRKRTDYAKNGSWWHGHLAHDSRARCLCHFADPTTIQIDGSNCNEKFSPK